MVFTQDTKDEPIANATVVREDDRGRDYLPHITAPNTGVDSELDAVWKKHIASGFQQNQEMFQKLLDAFMRPYWLTVAMYRILFGVGIAGFALGIILGVIRGAEFAAIFGGLSVVAFLAFFVSQPLRALERNLQFITWLGIIYNTYWTRLMYSNDPATIQCELESISKTTLDQIRELMNTHSNIKAKTDSYPEK